MTYDEEFMKRARRVLGITDDEVRVSISLVAYPTEETYKRKHFTEVSDFLTAMENVQL